MPGTFIVYFRRYPALARSIACHVLAGSSTGQRSSSGVFWPSILPGTPWTGIAPHRVQLHQRTGCRGIHDRQLEIWRFRGADSHLVWRLPAGLGCVSEVVWYLQINKAVFLISDFIQFHFAVSAWEVALPAAGLPAE